MGDTVEKSMFYGAKPEIFEKAKWLRKNMTNAESLLWDRLRSKQLMGLKFRTQHPIDIFIADFYCHSIKLVIEVDGTSHNSQKDYDQGREEEMKNMGITTIRFTNTEIENNIDKVIDRLKEVIRKSNREAKN